jgi:hypothetical protein
MDWLKGVLSSVLDRVKAIFTGNWAGDPRVAQALLGYATILTIDCVVSKSLFVLGVAAAAVVAYSVIKEMWRGDKLVLPDGGIQTLLNEASHYLVGCGVGAAVVILL